MHRARWLAGNGSPLKRQRVYQGTLFSDRSVPIKARCVGLRVAVRRVLYKVQYAYAGAFHSHQTMRVVARLSLKPHSSYCKYQH